MQLKSKEQVKVIYDLIDAELVLEKYTEFFRMKSALSGDPRFWQRASRVCWGLETLEWLEKL